MRRTNLVVARVGRHSLHPTWLDAGGQRTWDLYLCPYQELHEPPNDAITVGEVVVGPKWTGLRQLLNSWDGWREYERIWLPDDDIFATQGTIDRMFELAGILQFDLCAPALNEASYYAHFTTMRNRCCHARRTGFVEIMAPCFSREALDLLLPTLDLTTTGWGWGLDSLWPKLLRYENIGVIDSTPVLHTRPVGAFRDEALGRAVREESDRIMERYGCAQVHRTFAAIGADLQDLDLSAEALTVHLAEGWRYLFDSAPAVLPWLLAAQKPDGGWTDYPIAGSPARGYV
nr:DUF707 domain-containing protein [Caldimonas sp.]